MGPKRKKARDGPEGTGHREPAGRESELFKHRNQAGLLGSGSVSTTSTGDWKEGDSSPQVTPLPQGRAAGALRGPAVTPPP